MSEENPLIGGRGREREGEKHVLYHDIVYPG